MPMLSCHSIFIHTIHTYGCVLHTTAMLCVIEILNEYWRYISVEIYTECTQFYFNSSSGCFVLRVSITSNSYGWFCSFYKWIIQMAKACDGLPRGIRSRSKQRSAARCDMAAMHQSCYRYCNDVEKNLQLRKSTDPKKRNLNCKKGTLLCIFEFSLFSLSLSWALHCGCCRKSARNDDTWANEIYYYAATDTRYACEPQCRHQPMNVERMASQPQDVNGAAATGRERKRDGTCAVALGWLARALEHGRWHWAATQVVCRRILMENK